jgi:membrane-bound acyltransferase YfiQ involved in biofilm formation
MMWITIGVAIGLAAFRLSGHSYTWLIPVESISWILSVLSIGYKFLNKPGKALSYLSEAAYPVYIIHMIFQNLGSLLIFKLNLPAPMKFVMLVVFTLGGCLLCYELLIRRVKPVRLLFGLKMDNKKRTV